MHPEIHFSSPHWQSLLSANNLTTFEQFWDLNLEAVDEGNIGRGKNGWSRVSIHALQSPRGGQRKVVIKRQSNYRSRTLRHPLRGIPTFVKELENIQHYERLNVPGLQAIFCATRKTGNELQAVLVTEFLDDYQSLHDLFEHWSQHGRPSPKQSNTVITACAEAIASLHHAGLEHRCLFPKHIFYSATNTPSVRLIDLEKTRWRPWSNDRIVRDLTALARRSKQLTTRDRVIFLRTYCGSKKLDAYGKQLWNRIAKRIEEKQK